MDIIQLTAVCFFLVAIFTMFIAIAKGNASFENSWGIIIWCSSGLSIVFALGYFLATAGSTVYKFS